MKKHIALLLGLVLIVSVFSGCSVVMAGLVVLSPYIEEMLPTEAPTDPPEDVEPTVEDVKKRGREYIFPACYLA
jgi:hypothetical protein